MARIGSSMSWEGDRANLSAAGFSPTKIGVEVSVLTAAEGTYTVTESNTRRVMISHASTTFGDIRVAPLGVTGITSHFPLPVGATSIIDARDGEVIHVFNNNAGTIKVFFMEIA